MADQHTPYVLCIANDGYLASLERRKIYQSIEDPDAESHCMVRVIDESGEDYLYPATFFLPIQVPLAAERLFSGAA